MIVWSLQTVEAWESLQRLGVLRGTKGRVERYHLPAYSWIREQMTARIGAPPGRPSWPIWLWVQWQDAGRPRPDMRSRCHFLEGVRCVRLTLEIPAEQMLCSDFQYWHCVLNSSFLGFSQADEDHVDALRRELAPKHAQGTPWPAGLDEQVKRSWERILLTPRPRRIDGRLFNPRRSIQATCWQISMEQVQRVEHFVTGKQAL